MNPSLSPLSPVDRRQFLQRLGALSAGAAGLPLIAASGIPGASAPLLPGGTPWLERPWPRDPAKFNFAVIGDKTGGGLDLWPVFDRAIDEVNRLRPDFALMVGDLIQGYITDRSTFEIQWAEFLSHANRCEVPFLFFPGNHDISNPTMLAWWREKVGRTYYAFVYQDCLFLTLNTQEHWEGGGVFLGEEQTRWALDTLAAHPAVRHTFLFIHVPQWLDPTLTDYQRVDRALDGRPATVFAGHVHQLSYERRDGRDYIDMGPTGALLSPHPLKSLGLFHHFSMVTVEGGSTHIAHIEPGHIWPVDVARASFQQDVRQLLAFEALPVEGLGESMVRPGFEIIVRNALPGPVRLELEVVGAGAPAWTGPEGFKSGEDIPAGTTRPVAHRFAVPAAGLLPVPQLRVAAYYAGETVAKFQRNLGLYPEAGLREIPHWQVAGPFVCGEMPAQLPEHARTALPGAFALHGPELGYRPGVTYPEAGQRLAWRPLAVESQYGAGFLNLLHFEVSPKGVGAYAACRVRSPDDRIVYARFRVDAYGQIFVNGRGIDGEHMHRTRSDPVWVALPLRAGWNDLVVKAITIMSGWSFRLLLHDPQAELVLSAESAPR